MQNSLLSAIETPVPDAQNIRVIGLDLSCSRTGVVVLDLNGKIHHVSTVGGSVKRTAENVEYEKTMRLINIYGHISRVVLDYGVRAVGVERPAYSRKGAQVDLAELHGVVRTSLLTEHALEVYLIPVSSARKVALGRGGGKGTSKRYFHRLANEAAGVEFGTDDEADAWVIAEAIRISVRSQQGV